jgi:hypothetical protein
MTASSHASPPFLQSYLRSRAGGDHDRVSRGGQFPASEPSLRRSKGGALAPGEHARRGTIGVRQQSVDQRTTTSSERRRHRTRDFHPAGRHLEDAMLAPAEP